MINPNRSNIIDIIIRKAPSNPKLQELAERLSSLEDTGVPEADIAALKEQIENELVNYLNGYLSNVLEGFATWNAVDTEVARLDAKIDNITPVDTSSIATKAELDTEVSRLEEEIASINIQPSHGDEPGSCEIKYANFGDYVLASGRRCIAVKPDSYSVEDYPLEDYNPVGFVAYPVHWGLSGGLFTRVLSFRWLDPASIHGGKAPVASLNFRGTRDAVEYPQFQEYWNGIVTLDNSMAGKECTSYILSSLMNPQYQYGTPSNVQASDCFPAFAGAVQFEQNTARYSSLISSPYWYIPAYAEVSTMFLDSNSIRSKLESFIEKTEGEVITAAMSSLMTSSLAEEEGKYLIASESGQRTAWLDSAAPVRPMIRLI